MKQIILCSLLFFIQSIWSQTTIDMDADYILVDKGELTFLKATDGIINTKTEVRFYPVDPELGKEIKIRTVEATTYDIKRFHDISNAANEYSFVIDVSSIKTQKARKLLKKLKREKIYYKKSDKEIYQLTYYNQFSFKYSENHDITRQNNGVTKWGSYDEELTKFVVVNLKNKKPIIIFPYIKPNHTYSEYDRSDEKFLISYLGFIIPQKKTSLVKYFNEKFESSATTYPFLKGIQSNQDKTPSWSYNFKFEDSQLKDRVFGQVLLDKKFDTIAINNGFIFCLKDDKTTLYNLELENITPKDLQAAFPITPETTYAICLIGSTVKYISKKGETIPKLPKRFVRSRCISGYANYNTTYTIVHNEKGSLLSSKSLYYDSEDNVQTLIVEHKLFDKQQYEAVYFINNPYQEKLQTNYTPSTLRYTPDYIVIKNKGKFGLQSTVIKPSKNEQPNPFEFKELLPAEYDSIKRITENYILIAKDNLFGIYGLTEVKYAKLDVSEYFSRFTLPNGQKGWIDKLGREFLDE